MPLTPDEIIALLRIRGHRITAPRRQTVRILFEARAHLTVEDVHARLRASGIDSDEATAYRALQWLKEEGFAAQTDIGEGADVYCLIGEQQHHHLICLNCHHIIDADDQLFASLRDELWTRYQFQPRIDHFAIFGLCRHCQQGEKDSEGENTGP
jgi:Fur family ferric uptake transcriptional regulator